MGDDTRPTRRRVLRRTGAAAGAAAMAATGLGTASAVECRKLAYDTVVYDDCPPKGNPGPLVEAGAQGFSSCTAGDGTTYYYVLGINGAGYAPESSTEPC